MHYPGNEQYAAVLARLRAGVDSHAVVAALMDDIQRALDAGVSFEMSLALVDTYVDAVEEVIDGLRFVDLPAGWALTQYRTITEGTMGRWLRMLEPKAQLRAQRLLDALYARAVYELSGEAALSAAERFVAEHSIAAPAVSAIALCQTALLEKSVDAARRALPLIDVVNSTSTVPIDLLIAAQAEYYPGVHFARVLAEQEPRGRRQIHNLLAFEEEITAEYGYMFAEKASLIFGRKKRLADQETRTAFERKLIELVDGWGATPYAKRFKDYLMGRICAAHSDWGRATKLFRKALDGGFCEYMAVSQLAFILKARKKDAQVRALLEDYTTRWLQPRGPDSLFARTAANGRDIGGLYAEAGGDPTRLGADAPERGFVDAAAANESRALRGVERLTQPRAEAVARFWTDCRTRIVAALEQIVEARDIDDVVRGARSGRGLTFDPAIAARTHLDEVPDLAPIPRGLLLEAVAAPVSADRLASAFLAWLDEDVKTRGAQAQVERFTCVAGSAALARQRVGQAAADPAAARALVDAYQDAGVLGAADVVQLQLDVLAAMAPGAGQIAEAVRFLERDARIPAASREPLRIGVVQGLIGQLSTGISVADAEDRLKQLARWATPDEARGPVRAWWGGWIIERPPAERMRIAHGMDPALRDADIASAGVEAALAVIDRAPVTERVDAPLAVAGALASDDSYRDAVAAWYARGAEAVAEHALEQAIDVGAWLLGTLAGSSAETVRAAMRGLMDRRLAAAKGLAARRLAIDELREQFPDDPAIVALADAQRAAERRRRFTIAGVAAAVVAVAALVIALT